MSNNYIFASSRDWCVNEYKKHFEDKDNWYFVSSKHELTLDLVRSINPKYIFFPHWNWLVPEELTKDYDCVCFHMADVPYGRGGSPLQNLIVRGHKTTMLSALKMVQELDAGPVYHKVELSLDGSATEIFERAAPKIIELINEIILHDIVPLEQQGNIVTFERRTPEQSEILGSMNLEEIYDLIRMLDADSYPKAFISIGDSRIEFSNVKKNHNNDLTASVTIFSSKGK